LAQFADPQSWWARRDEIERLIANHLRAHPTQHWLDLLQPADVWCAPVLTLPDLVASEGFAALDMVQETHRPASHPPASAGPADSTEPLALATTRSPLRIDGRVLKDDTGAPALGAHTQAIRAEFGLDAEQPDPEQSDPEQPDTEQPDPEQPDPEQP
jgi:crotonobetainyl-CoA:carnitine CoA-transferase CaiB-like acyl-CoA transferase